MNRLRNMIVGGITNRLQAASDFLKQKSDFIITVVEYDLWIEDPNKSATDLFYGLPRSLSQDIKDVHEGSVVQRDGKARRVSVEVGWFRNKEPNIRWPNWVVYKDSWVIDTIKGGSDFTNDIEISTRYLGYDINVESKGNKVFVHIPKNTPLNDREKILFRIQDQYPNSKVVLGNLTEDFQQQAREKKVKQIFNVWGS